MKRRGRRTHEDLGAVRQSEREKRRRRVERNKPLLRLAIIHLRADKSQTRLLCGILSSGERPRPSSAERKKEERRSGGNSAREKKRHLRILLSTLKDTVATSVVYSFSFAP